MLWFRWYHGTCTDPKLGGIARRLGVKKTVVISVWALVLEEASAASDRGSVSGDADAYAESLQESSEDVARVLSEMRRLRMLTKSRVAKWETRQPKRDNSLDRVHRYRDKKRVTVTRVTRDSNANVTRVTALDKSREEMEENREQKTGDEAVSTSPLRVYLGAHTHAVTRMGESAQHSKTWESGLFALFGPAGTDELVWRGVAEADRPGILAKAIDRYAAEGRPFNGMYFRAFIQRAISEQRNDDDGTDGSGTAGQTGGATRGARAASGGEFDHLR